MDRLKALARRLHGYFSNPRNIRALWRMHSTIGYSGMPLRYINDGQYDWETRYPRDAFDHVMDFLADLFRTFRKMVREEMCDHPISKWYSMPDYDIDGEYIGEEYICRKCGGYV